MNTLRQWWAQYTTLQKVLGVLLFCSLAIVCIALLINAFYNPLLTAGLVAFAAVMIGFWWFMLKVMAKNRPILREVPHSQRVNVSVSKNGKTGWWAFYIFVGFVTFLIYSPKARYCLLYDTTPEYVTIDPQPADCDFLRAPIGVKGCHYEKEVVHWEDDDKNPRVVVSWNKVDDGAGSER